eukprot:TRINITY_DN7004_c0_g1_i4.p1 TRINITY_DN7004_c0_g1~~TRINITY_DN7004_c0_g1_i4.p1  ORF type:complete len:465 (+),score=94.77 TRINITY_DN7004_c0_g1_i4:1570-2964(+)
MSVSTKIDLHKHALWPGDLFSATITLGSHDQSQPTSPLPTSLHHSFQDSKPSSPTASETQGTMQSLASPLSPESEDGGMRISWVAAQIVGIYRVQRNVVNHKSLPTTHTRSSSFGSANAQSMMTMRPSAAKIKTALPNIYDELSDDSRCIFVSPPVVFAADFAIGAGNSKTFTLNSRLPPHLPPSFKGLSLKISYHLTVGVQQATEKVRLTNVPFRVLPGVQPCTPFPRELKDYDFKMVSSTEKQQQQLGDLSSFQATKESRRAKATEEEIRRNLRKNRFPTLYSIGHAQGALARCTLAKEHYRIGEAVQGCLDFSESKLSCIQLTIDLAMEESVNPEHILPGRTKPLRTVVASKSDLVLHAQQSSFSFVIPATACPAFTSDLVTLRWLLRITFYVAADAPTVAQFQSRPDQILPQLPDAKLEAVEWELPMHVYGCRDTAEGWVYMQRHRSLGGVASDENWART